MLQMALDGMIKIVNYIADVLYRLYGFLSDRFRELEIYEKIIVVASIISVLIPVLPVARFYIFDHWNYINNPLAVYFIGIIMVMLISVVYQRLWLHILRLVIMGYYLFWVLYLPVGNHITKAHPYELAYGYYVNIFASLAYIIICGLSIVHMRRRLY